MNIAATARTWHRWLFLVIGLQMLLWMLSGLYMVSVPLGYIHGDHLVAESESTAPLPAPGDLKVLLRDLPGDLRVTVIRPATHISPEVVVVESDRGPRLFDLATRRSLPAPDRTQIAGLAHGYYNGEAPPSRVRLLTEPLPEVSAAGLPLWQVSFPGFTAPTLYLSGQTGELVSKRHFFWRLFDFVWMFHIMDYDTRSDVNNPLLTVAAGISLIGVLSGVVLVLSTFRASGDAHWLNTLHKWTGIAVGLQLLIWTLSGLGMNLLDHHRVGGEHRTVPAPPAQALRADSIGTPPELPDTESGQAPRDWRLHNLAGRTVYEVAFDSGRQLYDAGTGQPVSLDEEDIRRRARERYRGDADIADVALQSTPSLETRAFPGPTWRVDFADSEATSMYLSAETGELQVTRTGTWRIFDLLWMLHMMDYGRQDSFNSWWIILLAALSLWLGVSGLILILRVFHWRDFLPGPLKPGHSLAIYREGAEPAHCVARHGDSLFDTLRREGMSPLSSCGGGGSCGLCRVTLRGAAIPVTEADARHLSSRALQAGQRLACQHRVSGDTGVSLPTPLAMQSVTVVGNRPLSESIHEITLASTSGDFSAYAPGQYRLVQVPDSGGGNGESRDEGGITRAYSMATPWEEKPGQLQFNVRRMPGGSGSQFLCSRQVGDRLQVSAAQGDFTVQPRHEALVMLGGGAGMAPLRAMLRHLLLQRGDTRPIQFLYGGRALGDLIYREEFDALAARFANFECHWAVQATHGDSAVATGTVMALCDTCQLAWRQSSLFRGFYVCGPPAMLAAVRERLSSISVPSEDVLFDDFGV